ncbi:MULTISPECIES: VolA/Pla-1 family phospholipase [unclassified Salinivibrio]|uniref:VolA/Pla-1 family phospholipase n=1 Tax=unclassified Salinivibrio TaxID=2636825 RepID=UPI00128C972C|nr:lipase [Salinivibrio sp. VYel7]MPX90286.1 lipase [Salinivibrio sp. VYel1]MPX93110.1 lipase [Salinivibrio sp. VYel9]MPX95206.1 lipase [Salinivibrio sp. VYel6]MPX99328.1 lipase [Salinivibrio sp. VYel4]MPY01965.1 lipase [Salinivibrio sp. VYel5]MPY05296.1 lipase [Salinivibrio sp. VYel8]MPY12484.1 lipase [Salinivibrio sp. VGrn1]
MLKTQLKLSVLATAIILAGCGDENASDTNTPQFESYIQTAIDRPTSVDFTLVDAKPTMPVPTFLLMDSEDGTLKIPTEGDNALTNPKAAMNTMDGWSTSMPLVFNFRGAGLNSGLVSNGVYLIELTESMTGTPNVKAVLQQGTDFQVLSDAASDTLTVLPIADLNASSEYIIALTDDIQDVNGDPIGMPSSYAGLKSQTVTYEDSLLEAPEAVIQGVEKLVAAAQGVEPTKIVYSTWFSTQSVGDSLNYTKLATANGLTAGNLAAVWKAGANPNNADLSDAYTIDITGTQDYDTALDADAQFTKYFDPNDADNIKAKLKAAFNGVNVNVSKGTIKLPYYLETDSNWNSQPFESATPSLVKVLNALQDPEQQATITAQLTGAGVNVAVLTGNDKSQIVNELFKLAGVTLTKADGSQLDPERIITRYSPVPQIKSVQEVPFLLFTPATVDSDTQLTVYQHGITSAKENAYFFAPNFANANQAIMAIDLPLHGQRSLDAKRSANVDVTAYLNLSNLAVARDNVRQSELDVMGLRAGLTRTQLAGGFAGTPLATISSFATSAPRLLGHSLGGIVGTTAFAAANRDNAATGVGPYYDFSALSVANSGGQIANLLLGSDSFGPLIKHSVAFKGSTAYQTFAGDNCTLDNSAENNVICYQTFEATGSASASAEVQGVIQQFSYAAQTLLDTVDPYTNAAYIDGNTTSIYMQQVDSDDTVPNDVAYTVPGIVDNFAGSEPLARKFLGKGPSEAVDTGSPVQAGSSSFVTFKGENASHSTFIFPQSEAVAEQAVHAEMIRQAVEFGASGTINAGGINDSVVN